MSNQSIAIKFPRSDVERIDRLVDLGDFISRSDLIREGARQLLEKQKTKEGEEERYILKMEEKGIFKNPELQVLANLFIEKKLSEKEKIIAKRLGRNPLKPIKISKGRMLLTEIGKDLAEGFIGSIIRLRKIKNVI